MPADFVFTDEHDALRQNLRDFLAKRSDEKAVRATMVGERGFDPEVWKQLAEELGLVGLLVPEEFGGAGMNARARRARLGRRGDGGGRSEARPRKQMAHRKNLLPCEPWDGRRAGVGPAVDRR